LKGYLVGSADCPIHSDAALKQRAKTTVGHDFSSDDGEATRIVDAKV